ncbi:chloroplast sensor kinase, chloroplastic [Tanacetum coccineum]
MASESDSSQPLPEVSDVKTSTSIATEQINSYAANSSSQPTTKVTDVKPHTSTVAKHVNISAVDSSFVEPTPIVSSSNEVQNLPKTATSAPNSLQNGGTRKWGFPQIANGFGLNLGQRTPGANDSADILIVIGNFSIPIGLRVAEASLLKQQVYILSSLIIRFVVGFLVAELPKLEIRKEEDDVKPSSLSKDSYAVYPYSIPKSWEIQSFIDKTLDLANFSAEQRLNAINISRSIAMAYVMDQKAMLLQQSSWQNNVRMNNLVEQVRLAVTMKKNEIPYDIIEDIMVLGDHMKNTLQQLLEAVQVIQSLEVAVEEPAMQQALSNLIEGALLRTNVGAMVEIVSTSAPAGRALIIIDDDGPDMHYMLMSQSKLHFTLIAFMWNNQRLCNVKKTKGYVAAIEMMKGKHSKPPKRRLKRQIIDPISSLPACLLVDIISCLDSTEEAIRTCTLSKRWQFLWPQLPNLNFIHNVPDEDHIIEFYSSLENILSQYGQSNINKFQLHASYTYGVDVETCIRYAIDLNV